MGRTIIFLLQDVAFGYFWLIYREPRDVFSVYSEFSKFKECHIVHRCRPILNFQAAHQHTLA